MEKGNRFLMLLVCLLSLSLLSGCIFTIPYYPTRVAEPNKLCFGMGVSGYFYKDYNIFESTYLRYGLPNGFDIGGEIYYLLYMPTMLGFSARKQFNLPSSAGIDAVSLSAGITSVIFSPTWTGAHIGISMLKENLGITLSVEQFPLFSYFPDYVTSLIVDYDIPNDKFHFAPFAFFQVFAADDYDYQPTNDSFLTKLKNSITDYQIGFGIKIYFNP